MKRLSIKFQILLIAMIPVFLIDTILTYINITNNLNQAEQILQSKGAIIARQIAGASEFYLYSGNHVQIQHLLDQVINTNDIVFAALYNPQGNAVAKAEGQNYSADDSHEYFYYRHAIQTSDVETTDLFEPDTLASQDMVRNLGWIHLFISRQQLEKNKLNIYKEGLAFFIAMLVIAAVLTSFISKRITRPIFTLLDHLKGIETGKLGLVIQNIENNEIGDVQKGFNSMSQSLLANRMQLDKKIKTATLELMNAITDLEYKNKELGVARDVALNADKVKSRFLANMSHEIRTPINGIKGFINLLSKSKLDSDQKRYADIISHSTHDLTSIVNEVLDYSKIESGHIEVIESAFDLYELIETTRDSLYTVAMEKNIDLHLSVYSDTPKMIIGDDIRLKQILINLIGNAIKFTDSGYVSIRVWMDDESDDQIMIKFEIRDSGIGISKQNQESLFKAFKQIDSDSNRRFSGTGLGLVISKNLANLMGGDIHIESEPDKGSLFTLILPFKPFTENTTEVNALKNQNVIIYAFNQRCISELQSLYNRLGFSTQTELIIHPQQIEPLQIQLQKNLEYIDLIVFDLRHNLINPDNLIIESVRKQKRIIVMHYDPNLVDMYLHPDYEFISVINTCAQIKNILFSQETEPTLVETTNNKNTAAKKVLLVDDNQINLTLASELTSLWGHIAFEAQDAREAMEFFKKEQFDLILLDIQMPEIDGIELMQMMRTEKPDLDIPIAAITANILEKEKQRLLGLGFDAYISKPVDENKLRKLLDHDIADLDDPISLTLEPDSTKSLDYELTLNLSARNESLVWEIFSLLQREIPEHITQLHQAIKSRSVSAIAAILHKLQGITCYAGLPRLKHLISRYENLPVNSSEDQIYELITLMIEELDNIFQALGDYNTTHIHKKLN